MDVIRWLSLVAVPVGRLRGTCGELPGFVTNCKLNPLAKGRGYFSILSTGDPLWFAYQRLTAAQISEQVPYLLLAQAAQQAGRH